MKRTGSSASVSSESTQYSVIGITDDMIEEVDRAESILNFQPVQPQDKQPSDTCSSTSLKRKREALFKVTDDHDYVSVSESSTSKIPRMPSTFSTSLLHKTCAEQSAIVIPSGSLRTAEFLADMPIGLLWELARILSLLGHNIKSLKFDVLLPYRAQPNQKAAPAVLEHCKALFGFEAQAADVRFAAAFSQEKSAQLPWEELDKEEEMEKQVCSTQKQALYLQNTDEMWYGGKVHFCAKLKQQDSAFSLELEPPYLGSSNRFTRRFGSKRVIRVRLEHQLKNSSSSSAQLLDYVKQPFVIFGRVFRAYYTKEGRVFLIQTNEVVQYTEGTLTFGSLRRGNPLMDMTLLDFLNWHNPLKSNNSQSITKWASRFALGLSNSVPSVYIEPQNCHQISDIICDNVSTSKIPTESIMTDGCGFANANFFHLLQQQFHWDSYPTAVQMRIAGAKGLLVLHPKHAAVTADLVSSIWIRPSQIKIYYPPTSSHDHAQYTMDILRASHMSSPAHLSEETIINLAENGVNSATLAVLLRSSFTHKMDKLTTWEGSDGLYQLWQSILREGGVIAARAARQETGSARAKGFVYEDATDEWEDDDSDLAGQSGLLRAVGEKSVAWWEDSVSGQPSSLEETCLVLLDSGFTPASNPVLRSKLRYVAEKSIKSLCTKYHLAVPMSCSAFVIPDPCNILEPGEVHIKSSHRNLMDRTGRPTDTIVGDVLLTRHPCKVPTDIQQAKAVFKIELKDYMDVIIVSTKGHIVNGETLARHLASMTGGGDYDGDLMTAYWQPELLEGFKPADKSFAEVPKAVSDCIEKSTDSVDTFLAQTDLQPSEQISRLQDYLLGSLKSASLVGIYSKFWEYSMYVNGYSHPETIRLAYLFCAVLDAAKTGVTVKPEQLASDRKRYSRPEADWKNPVQLEDKGTKFDTSNLAVPRRTGLPEFIMDVLKQEVKKEYDANIVLIHSRLGPISMPPDEDLRRPWKDFLCRVDAEVARGNNDLKEIKEGIEAHVQAMRDRWKKERSQDSGKNRGTGRMDRKGKGKQGAQPYAGKGKGKATEFTSMPIELRQDILRQLSQSFARHPEGLNRIYDETELARLKASYAYCLTCVEHGIDRFAYDVATRALCSIKARAVSNGTEKTVAANFYARFVLHRAFLGNH